jgi:hypothetical protein
MAGHASLIREREERDPRPMWQDRDREANAHGKWQLLHEYHECVYPCGCGFPRHSSLVVSQVFLPRVPGRLKLVFLCFHVLDTGSIGPQGRAWGLPSFLLLRWLSQPTPNLIGCPRPGTRPLGSQASARPRQCARTRSLPHSVSLENRSLLTLY